MMAHVWRLGSIALRNVARQRRRSLAVIVALSLAVGTLVVVRGVINGVQTLIKRRIVYGQVGSVSVRLETSGSTQPLFDPADLPLQGAPRLGLPIIVSKGDRSIVVWGSGLDPVRDLEVCPAAAEEIGAGRWVQDGTAVTTPGIADALDAKLGDEVVLLANDADGVLNAAVLKLGGLLKGPPKQSSEDRIMFLPLAVAQSLLRVERRVGELVLSTREPEGAPALAASLRAALPDRYEVRTWQDVAPFIVDLIMNQERVLRVVGLIFAVVSALGISHSLVLTIMARKKELGTMLALGLRRRSLLAIVIMETTLLSVVAAALGALVGGVCVIVANTLGIPIVLPGADTPDLVRPHIAAADLLLLCSAAIVVATIASFVPARRASRATPMGVLVSR